MDSDTPTDFERNLAEQRNETEDTTAEASMREDGGSVNRRSVLGGLSAATASTAALSGTASASSDVDGPASLSDRQLLSEAKSVLPEEYAKKDLEAMVEAESANVIQTLSEEGFLSEASLDAFDEHTQDAIEAVDLQQGKVAMTVSWESVREQPVVELFARIETENGEIRLHNSPSVDIGAAATIFEDGERVGSVTAEGSTHEFSSSDAGSVECRQCYKTCSPFPEIRGNEPCSTACSCGGCDPGTSCDDDGGGGW